MSFKELEDVFTLLLQRHAPLLVRMVAPAWLVISVSVQKDCMMADVMVGLTIRTLHVYANLESAFVQVPLPECSTYTVELNLLGTVIYRKKSLSGK